MVDFNKDLVFAIVVFVMAVILISQSAIVVYTYRKDDKAKDSNYWWSVFVLVLSIIGLLSALGGVVYSQRKVGGGNAPKAANAASAAAGSQAPQAAPMMMVPVPALGPVAQPVKTN